WRDRADPAQLFAHRAGGRLYRPCHLAPGGAEGLAVAGFHRQVLKSAAIWPICGNEISVQLDCRPMSNDETKRPLAEDESDAAANAQAAAGGDTDAAVPEISPI